MVAGDEIVEDEIAAEGAGSVPPMPRRRRSPKKRKSQRRRSWAEAATMAFGPPFSHLWHLLPLLFLLIPAHDFFHVAIQRMWYPFEHEWLEGELAIYSFRFTQNPSLGFLYPEYELGRYVPHLYPPVYQIICGILFWISGHVTLGWGRLVSVLATAGILGAVFAIVRHHTRATIAAAIGALSFLMFFKPSGYWFDLYRVDSLAWCLGLWSAFFIGHRSGRNLYLGIGLFLCAAAFLTKQVAVMAPLGVLCARICFELLRVVLAFAGFASPKLGRIRRFVPATGYTVPVVVLFYLLMVGALLLVPSDVLNRLEFYLLKVPETHGIYWDTIRLRGRQELWQHYLFTAWLIPAGLWIPLLTMRWKRPAIVWPVMLLVAAAVGFGAWYWIGAGTAIVRSPGGDWGEGKSSILSPESLQFVAATWPASLRLAAALCAAAFLPWLYRWIAYRTALRGVAWVILLFSGQHLAAVTWVKIGGYINNYMPLFAVQSVALGLAIGWIYRAGRNAAWRHAVPPLVLGSLALAWYGTRIPFVMEPIWDEVREEQIRAAEESGEQDPATVRIYTQQVNEWVKRKKRVVSDVKPLVDIWKAEELARMPWWYTDGLRYHYPDPPMDAPYGNQIPPEDSMGAWQKTLLAIRRLNEDGGVYLPHNNYIGMLAGVAPGPSVDAIRDINYAQRPTPKPLLDSIRNRETKHIVLMSEIKYDWLPGDFKVEMESNYKLTGPLVPRQHNPMLTLPKTGAMVRPAFVYTRMEEP